VIIIVMINVHPKGVINVSAGAVMVPRKKRPSFTDEQIVNATDVQRNWKEVVEPRLSEVPYLIMLSRYKPKAAILDYPVFVDLWQRSMEYDEMKLKMEVLLRYAETQKSGRKSTTLQEWLAEENITMEDLEEMPDVDIEPGQAPKSRLTDHRLE